MFWFRKRTPENHCKLWLRLHLHKAGRSFQSSCAAAAGQKEEVTSAIRLCCNTSHQGSSAFLPPRRPLHNEPACYRSPQQRWRSPGPRHVPRRCLAKGCDAGGCRGRQCHAGGVGPAVPARLCRDSARSSLLRALRNRERRGRLRSVRPVLSVCLQVQTHSGVPRTHAAISLKHRSPSG